MKYKVYFITYGKKSGNPTKIGVTSNLERRIKTLQVSCPFDMKCTASICFDDRELAYKFEHFMHVKLRKHWIRGEWFRSGYWNLNKIVSEYSELKDVEVEVKREKIQLSKDSIENDLRKQILNLRLEINRLTNN